MLHFKGPSFKWEEGGGLGRPSATEHIKQIFSHTASLSFRLTLIFCHRCLTLWTRGSVTHLQTPLNILQSIIFSYNLNSSRFRSLSLHSQRKHTQPQEPVSGYRTENAYQLTINLRKSRQLCYASVIFVYYSIRVGTCLLLFWASHHPDLISSLPVHHPGLFSNYGNCVSPLIPIWNLKRVTDSLVFFLFSAFHYWAVFIEEHTDQGWSNLYQRHPISWQIQDVLGDWQVGKERQRGRVGRTCVYQLLILEAHMVLHNALPNCLIVLVYILLKITSIKKIIPVKLWI